MTEAWIPDDDEAEILRQARQDSPGRWLCKDPICRQPVEANPALYLSLTEDGTWYIEGVGDEWTPVVCTEGHDQQDPILLKSLTAFLEETFPGGTWEGSDPRNRDL
jgi:hypothetical protein